MMYCCYVRVIFLFGKDTDGFPQIYQIPRSIEIALSPMIVNITPLIIIAYISITTLSDILVILLK